MPKNPIHDFVVEQCLTLPEFARKYRMGRAKATKMVKTGQVRAINIASEQSTLPRWVIPPEACKEFEASRRVVIPPVRRRQRRKQVQQQQPTAYF